MSQVNVNASRVDIPVVSIDSVPLHIHSSRYFLRSNNDHSLVWAREKEKEMESFV